MNVKKALRRPGLLGSMIVGTLLLLSAGEAAAQANSSDKAAAEAAFDDARRLTTLGKYAEACPKFAESHRLDPGIGVLLYLGDCYERNGQTASAWAAFREAIPAARAAGQSERERTARERASALEPKLLRLAIVVPSASDMPGLEIRRDGGVVGRPLWGSPIPVDPGPRVVEVTAPGKVKWSKSVAVSAAQPVSTLTIPSLEDAGAGRPPDASSAPPSSTQPGSTWSSQKTAAIVAGGVGAVGVAIGSIFGAMTFSNWSKVKDNPSCHGKAPILCDGEGTSAASDANTTGLVSTIGFVAGGAALAAGVVLWVTAPKSRPNPPAVGLSVTPLVGPGALGLSLEGAF